MNRFKTALIIAALAAVVVTPGAAQKVDTGRAMFEAAKQKETLEGDLPGAIRQYQAIVDKYSKTDRGAAADALVAMAGCYQKQGDAQGRKVLERVVRDFADQKDAAAVARTRLGESAVTTAAAGMMNRQKWTGTKVDVTGSVSRDGRYLSFVDWDTGDLALHDLSSGVDRRLTNKGTWNHSLDFAEGSTISPDGAEVAYAWYADAKGRYEIRTIKLDASGPAKPRTILENPDIAWFSPFDWSPDGKWLAVALSRMDRTEQLGLVNVADGSLRVLKSTGVRGISRMFFSPDGALVAYDRFGTDASGQRDVYVSNTDGSSQEIAAVVHPASDVIMGWSPDGRSLLFASDRAGSMGIWLVPFMNGRPQGAPRFLKDLGSPSNTSLGLTRAGALFHGVRLGAPHIEIASFDFKTGKMIAAPKQMVESYVLDNRSPDWSWDGKQMVYVSEGPANRSSLAIQSVETGSTRQIRLAMRSIARPRWAGEGSIIVQGTDTKGQQGIYRVEVQTEEVFPVVISRPGEAARQPTVSSDGKRLFYVRVGNGDVAIIQRNLASGTERELQRRKIVVAGLSVSPDGRQLTFIEIDRPSRTSVLYAMSADGGPARELFRPAEQATLQNLVEWTPDGQRLVFSTFEGEKTTYWVMPSAGGTPVRFEIDSPGLNALRIHPDGRRVAYNAGARKWEVWTLENFLPAVKK
jgi:Tol biopolymer transport system component